MLAIRLPLLLAVFLMQAVVEKPLQPLLDFAGPDSAQKWQAVNDNVMGGRAPLPTTRDEWTEVSVPLEEFIPTAFGNQVQGMGPVEPDQINSLGFMLSDKKPGPFKLEVDWVKITPTATP
jgi:hypothetical protein